MLLPSSLVTAIVLSAAAMLSVGPSPAAAYAECWARTAREYKAKRLAAMLAKQGKPPPMSSPAEPLPDKPDRPDSPTFVAPKVVKSADHDLSSSWSGHGLGGAQDLSGPRASGELVAGQAARLRGLHHPVYQALAPPPCYAGSRLSG